MEISYSAFPHLSFRICETQLFFIQSMKRSYLFEEIVQTIRRYIAVHMHTAHYFRNSFHFDQGGG